MFQTIKMINFNEATKTEQQSFSNQILEIFKQNGFLLLESCYISAKQQQELFSLVDFFFKNLTKEICQEIKYNKSTNRGLSAAESLDENSIDTKEIFNLGYNTGDIPNILPSSPKFKEFNHAILTYLDLFYNNLIDLLKAIALASDLPEDFLLKKHNKTAQTLRLLHYPSVSNITAENQFAVSPHTDYGSLTMLIQDHSNGISVQDSTTKEWDTPDFKPGNAIINVGDLLMRWSNDVFKSNPHRVLSQNSGKSRYSVVFFMHPGYSETIACIPKFRQDKEKYAAINSLDYLNNRLNSTYKQEKV